MKGTPDRQAAVYHTFDVEDLIEASPPLRPIKRMMDAALAYSMRKIFSVSQRGSMRQAEPSTHGSPVT